MAKSYSTMVKTQDSIYLRPTKGKEFNREMNVYFSVPEAGVNEDTGILLLIAGFGGHGQANIYKKMRDTLADMYNLVTVQCDYFGYEYLQNADPVNGVSYDTPSHQDLESYFNKEEMAQIFEDSQFRYSRLLELGKSYPFTFWTKARMNETPGNFNDMGLHQCLDNIIAVLSVMGILYDNEFFFNTKRTILYGHSHGSFLSYMCNRMAPGLFKLLIDNSGWLTPVYMSGRKVGITHGNMVLGIEYEYLATKLVDPEMISLSYLYNGFKNQCRIEAYIAGEDNLIDCNDKIQFCEKINRTHCHLINEKDIDGLGIRSAGHGFDADFIKFFQQAYKNADLSFEKDKILDLPGRVSFRTKRHRYDIDYSKTLPMLTIR